MDTNSAKILIVEDNLIDVATLIYTLKKEKYNITYASNGQEAIEKASDTLFDLILSDLSMPLMDGNELIRQIRKKTEYRHTPFLFISGAKQEETWIKNLDDGADDFITKPFNANILSSKIKAHLRKASHKKNTLANSKKNNLISDLGKFIYCKSDDFSLEEKDINCKIINTFSIEDVRKISKTENIWSIIIDENTSWAIRDIHKIREIVETTPIFVLISCNSNNKLINKLMNFKVNGFIHKNTCSDIVSFDINNIIQNEINLKEKYISALRSAANNSPTRFDNEYLNTFNGFSIDIKHEAYGEMPGGDFYEIFNISLDKKIIIIGDVMGKKWDAWFFVPAYLAYIRSTIHFLNGTQDIDFVKQPNKFLEIINNYIYKDLKLSDSFTTLSIITICTKCSKLRIASAGALRPFYLNNNKLSQINIVGTLLGVIDDIEYQQYEHDFENDDKLIFYTDGYTEATNSISKDMIDEIAFKSVIDECAKDKQMTTKHLENRLIEKYNIKEFDDDRTLLVISKEDI